MNRRTVLAASATLAALTLGLVALAGPINPPAGPIVPTNKTLQEVFDNAGAAEPRIAINAANSPGDNDATPSLFKITQPGSYYLTGNITGVAGKHGIEIASSGVTLDLNGFDVAGVPGSLNGVFATVNLQNLSLLNGSVRSWGIQGIQLNVASNCRVDSVRAAGNAVVGFLLGQLSSVTNCTAVSNGSHGFSINSGSSVSGCVAGSNSGHGFEVGGGCSLSGCAARLNLGDGFAIVTNGANIVNCVAAFNSGDGIEAVQGNVILNNTLFVNGNGAGDGAGIHITGFGNRIEGNNCSTADRGIDVDAAGNIIIRNTCAGNATDWDIVAGNIYGPIIDRRAAASPAVTGFAAGGTLTSTDPNANFSY